MAKGLIGSAQMKQAKHDKLLAMLRARFDEFPERHEGLKWASIESALAASPTSLKVLAEMEATGGEPDVIGRDGKVKAFIFCDCAAESPKERRSLCYDDTALKARKTNKPAGSAMQMAAEMGVQLLTEDEYRALQQLGEFDLKTSSWLRTPPGIRDLGGAIFGDRRFDQVFIYHNGAESYYAGRGFRATLRV